jgi:hypothetical protein
MREQIIKAVIDVVEEGMRESAPRGLDDASLDNIIAENRPHLLITAEKIADRVVNV